MPATTRWNRCGSRRVIARGAASSRPDYNPYEAGLGFAVKLDKGDFIGRDALVAAKGKPPARRLLGFVATTSETPLAHGGELILRNGEPAGEVTSAAYGHTVGGIVALGYVIDRQHPDRRVALSRPASRSTSRASTCRCGRSSRLRTIRPARS